LFNVSHRQRAHLPRTVHLGRNAWFKCARPHEANVRFGLVWTSFG